MPDELRWFWQAFHELDTCRNYIDGSPTRIPWTAVKDYAQYHDIDFDYLWHLIVSIDTVFVQYYANKRKAELDSLKNKSKGANKGGRRGRR